MAKPIWVSGYRIVFALMTLIAMGYQFFHNRDIDPNFSPANFFSFFTIQSNLLAAAVFLFAAFSAIPGRNSRVFDYVRGAAMLYMSTTFVVYGLLLSGYTDELQTALPWVNTVVHKIMPLAIMADWLIVPPARKFSFRQGLVWLSYPAIYVIFTLIRGPRVDWYPYPFLDPREDGGYGRVALYCVGITLGILAFTWVVTWITRWRVKEELVPPAVQTVA